MNIQPTPMDLTMERPSSPAKLIHSSDRHPRHTLEAINVLRKHRELCDVVLIVGKSRIFAHRIVLSACSPYFHAMFLGELAESRQAEVTIKDIDETAVELLIDFCYTSTITVEESNVQTLLPAACLLQLAEIQDVCCEFLKRQLDPSNCLGIRAFADTHACRDLLRIADKFTQQNFQEVMESEEFMLLPVSQLIDIISSDELSVRTEEQVFSAVKMWVQHNMTERRPHLYDVLQHVRLCLVSPKFLVGTVGADILIKSDESCRDLVDEAKNYLLLPQERPDMQGPRTRPRKPTRCGEVLFADQQDDMYSFLMTETKTKKSHTRAKCVAICVILCGLFFLAGYLLAYYILPGMDQNTTQELRNGREKCNDGVLPTCIITGISVGYDADEYHLGNRSRIEIVTEANETRLVRFRNRGIIVLKVNSSICQPLEISFFDTYDLDYMSELFIHYIGDIKDGDYIILLTCDEFTEHLSDDARNLLRNISNGTVIFDFRATLAVAFVKQSASSFCTMEVDAKSASMEPARITVNSTAIQGCQTM